MIATGKELHNSWYPKTTIENLLIRSPTINNEKGELSVQPNLTSGQISQDFSRLYKEGTGSNELNKFQVIKHLGKDGIISELFLIKDEQGNRFVLKRFLSDEEQIEESKLYAFFWVFTFPIQIFKKFAELFTGNPRLIACNKVLEITQQVSDSNLLKAYRVIENNYSEICGKTGESKTKYDVYLLMEYFEGTSIEKLGSSANFLSYLASIAQTFVNVSGIDYFYDRSYVNNIKVNEKDNQLKFTSFDFFKKIINRDDSWKDCIDIYENIYTFFANLIKSSNLKEKDSLLSKLNDIFTHYNLVEQFKKAKDSLSEEMQKKLIDIFTIDYLKSILKQIQDLFTTV